MILLLAVVAAVVLYANTTTVAAATSAATLKQVAVEKTRTPLRELVYIRARYNIFVPGKLYFITAS